MMGCPNCLTDSTERVLPWTDFTIPSLRQLDSKLQRTVIYECKNCQTQWLRIDGGHLLHKLYPEAKRMVENFFDTANYLSTDQLAMLRTEIGSAKTGEEEEVYPCSITTNDGDVFLYAVIRIIPSIWPIAYTGCRFLSEIKEITPSAHALTFDQRQALQKGHETREVGRVLQLQRDDGFSVVVSESSLFLPENLGPPSRYIVRIGENRGSVVRGPDAVVFIGPPS